MKFLRNPLLLSRASAAWESWASFRHERRRNKRFTYGRQWDDLIRTPEGLLSEDSQLRREGAVPLSSNMIRRTVRNVTGVWRNTFRLPSVAADAPAETRADNLRLLENMRLNHAEELYARSLEEFLISGVAIHRKWHGARGGMTASWTDVVSPDLFFMETSPHDFRGWDLRLVGQIHDLDFSTLCARFARSGEDKNYLASIYGIDDAAAVYPAFGMEADAARLSFATSGSGGCRVIEIWQRVERPSVMCHDPLTGSLIHVAGPDSEHNISAENLRRREKRLPLLELHHRLDETWTWHCLTPFGDILAEGDTPYNHGSHPFVVKAYPYIDGEVHSFVSDIIDQQKVINRLITLYDRVLRASAKGVLMFPEHAVPPGADLTEIARQWSRADGVITYTAKAGMPVPQQAGGLGAVPGITDLLTLQMKMMEDISGVNSALKGKLESSATSGTLYEHQTRNALTSIRDITATFNHFLTLSQAKDLANLRQWGR